MSTVERAAVVVIGAGPAGIGVATGLAKRGVGPLILIDRRDAVGGMPALYRSKPGGVPTFVLWWRGRVLFGQQLAERLAAKLSQAAVEVWLESQVTEVFPREKRITVVNPRCGKLQVTADAVVLACGARERSAAERGWITGARPAGVFFTKNLLDLTDRNGLRFSGRPAIVGSDLVAYAVAAKLKADGSPRPAMVDQNPRPRCSLPARIYFSRWAKPEFLGCAGEVRVAGQRSLRGLRLPEGAELGCGSLIICGELVPNSELALMAGLRVELPSRRPAVDSGYQMSEPGWFAAGNILGGSRGAEWCYRNGCRVARYVAGYLKSGAATG